MDLVRKVLIVFEFGTNFIDLGSYLWVAYITQGRTVVSQ